MENSNTNRSLRRGQSPAQNSEGRPPDQNGIVFEPGLSSRLFKYFNLTISLLHYRSSIIEGMFNFSGEKILGDLQNSFHFFFIVICAS